MNLATFIPIVQYFYWLFIVILILGSIIDYSKYKLFNLENMERFKQIENIYNIIEKGSDAMEGLLDVARETEHPRAYEVVGQLVDKLTNANKELMGLHKTKKSMSDEVVRSPQNVTNALFVGSTADLQKMLKQKSKKT